MLKLNSTSQVYLEFILKTIEQGIIHLLYVYNHFRNMVAHD
jgi:hypothetical protein